MAKKITLRERNRAAMGEGRDRDVLALTPEPEQAAEPEPQATPKASPRPRATVESTTRTASTVRLTVYFPAAGILEDARSAYIAQLDGPNPQTSFARWLSAILEDHNARTPHERDAIARHFAGVDQDNPPHGGGKTRAFDVYETTLAATDDVIRTDRTVRPAPNRSSYAVEALREATRTIREANGGQLPPAPHRLPNMPQVD